MTRSRAAWLAVLGAAVFAVALPTSIGGQISRPLSMVSLVGTCAWLGLLLAIAPRSPAPIGAAAGLSVFGVPLLFTITSPFTAVSFGVVVLYAAMAMLYGLDLRAVEAPGIEYAFGALTAAALALGYAIALDVTAVDRVLVQWYGAFYPELLTNMVVLNDKPVLTFGTHSMAGFVIYLLFFVQFTAWRRRGGWWRAAPAAGYVGLLFLLTSTTGGAFGVVAAGQMAFAASSTARRYSVIVGVIAAAGVVAAGAALGVDPAALAERAEEAVVGDRVRGLFARYATDGLLASSLAYLSESPLSPIGFSATESLYLGDSGLVVNLLRGSLPLLVAVYGGLWVFLRANLQPRTAAWIWVCTVAFEIGFTPLQYFRFVALAPLLVVGLNRLGTSAAAPATARPAPGGL